MIWFILTNFKKEYVPLYVFFNFFFNIFYFSLFKKSTDSWQSKSVFYNLENSNYSSGHVLLIFLVYIT